MVAIKSLKVALLPLLLTIVSAQDLCPVVKRHVPSFCTASSKCNVIKCPWSIGSYFAGDLSATLAPCGVSPRAGESPRVALDVDVNQPVSVDWSNTWLMNQTDEVPVPGATFDLDVATLGLNGDVALSGNISALEIKLGLDVCASVFDVAYCGSDLVKVVPALNGSIPWIVFDTTFNFSSVCTTWEAR